MSSQPSVEKLLALLQQEREKQRCMEKETDHLKHFLSDEKKKTEHLQNTYVKISAQNDQVQMEMDKIRANTVSLLEKNSDYVQQIELALSDVQYGDMSLGDLYRLSSIYLNEMNRVNDMISKLTKK